MSIGQRIQLAKSEFLESHVGDKALEELRRFYLEKIRAGVAQAPEYKLPLLDTIGLIFQKPPSA